MIRRGRQSERRRAGDGVGKSYSGRSGSHAPAEYMVKVLRALEHVEVIAHTEDTRSVQSLRPILEVRGRVLGDELHRLHLSL